MEKEAIYIRADLPEVDGPVAWYRLPDHFRAFLTGLEEGGIIAIILDHKDNGEVSYNIGFMVNERGDNDRDVVREAEKILNQGDENA